VPKYRLLEVVSGLGMGGAEKALMSRMRYADNQFERTIINLRPEIDFFEPDPAVNHFKIKDGGLSRILQAFDFVKNNSFDLIIVRTPLDAIRFGLFRFLLRNRMPRIVFEAHSTFVSEKLGVNWILGFLLKRVSKQILSVVAVSKSVKSGKLCRGYKDVKVIYLGGDLSRNSISSKVPEKPRLIFVGRLVDLKRPIWLLKIMNRLNSKMNLSDSVLTIVGTGPLEKEVREYIEQNDLSRVVKFVGLQTDLSSFYSSASHLISASTHEGLPLTFFEAKLSGLCILSTPSGGGAEIFSEEDFELATFEADEFEAAVLRILQNPAPSIEIRKRIQSKSSWMSVEQCSKKYHEYLYSLIKD
jgi:glycosyltransferase involved in cell wall biosynthesis